MDNDQINSIAQGIMLHLMDQSRDPIDALSVILCVVLLFYEKAKAPRANFTIEEFAERFGRDMIKHWKSRTVTAKGTDRVQ